MVRSLRIASLCICTALALAAWGCGASGGTRPRPDGSTTPPSDGPHIQLDGSPVTQTDGPTTPLGDGGTPVGCTHPTGTVLLYGICKADGDCKCNNNCFSPDSTQFAGSCQAGCDPAKTDQSTGQNPDCPTPASQACLKMQDADTTGACLNAGTFNGTFDAKLFITSQVETLSDLMDCNVTLQVGTIDKTYLKAAAVTQTAGTTTLYIVFMFSGTATQPNFDDSVMVAFAADAKYAANSTYDLSVQTDTNLVFLRYDKTTSSGTTISKDLVVAENGILDSSAAGMATITLTAAGTADGDHITGTITNVPAFELEWEICGPDSPAPNDTCS